MIQIMAIIKIYAILIQMNLEQILIYMIGEMNLINIILFAQKIVYIIVIIQKINKSFAIVKLKRGFQYRQNIRLAN